MDSATPPATATDPDPNAIAPCVLLVDGRSARRAESARQLATSLPGVRISECSDESEALLRLASVKHALMVLDVASCGGRARVASQYWQLTSPDMEQILVHDDAAALSYLGRGDRLGVAHCAWSDMPGPLLNWAQRYRGNTASGH